MRRRPSFAFVALLLVLLLGVPAAAQGQSVLDSLEARLAQRPGDTALRLQIADRLVAADRQPAAIVVYEEALDAAALSDAERLDVARRLAQLYSWNERPDDALRMYEVIAELTPDDVTVRRELAQRYFWAERPRDGIRQLEDVLARQPDDLDARRQLAQQYLWNETPDRAITEYEALLRRRPDDVEVLGTLAQQYLWNSRLDDAATLYRRLLAQRPDSVDARLSLAKALAWNGRGDEALPVLDEVLRAQPDQPEALLLAGELQRWRPSEWRQGRRRLRRVQQADPGNERVEELLRGLRTQYGPQAEAQYRRISDSNGLTVEHLPLAFGAYATDAWQVEARLATSRFSDAQFADSPLVDEEVRGYEAAVAVMRAFGTGTQARAEVSGATYTTDWTPITLGLQVTQALGGGISLTGRYQWDEVENGVAALDESIRAHTVAAEGYAQVTRRLALSGLLSYARYSDDNGRFTAFAGGNLQVRQANPGLGLSAGYSFDDTGTIYPNSVPYWTPEALSTVSAQALVDQTLFGWLRLGGGGGAALQEGELGGVFNLRVGIENARFHALSVEYERTGSSAYSATVFGLRYAYRF